MAVDFHSATVTQLNVLKELVGVRDPAVKHLDRYNERIRDGQFQRRMKRWDDVASYLSRKRCSAGLDKFSDDKVISHLNDLFTFKEPINDMKNERSFIERRYPRYLADVVVQCRADAGGFLHSWLQLRVALNNAEDMYDNVEHDVERLQREFSMPVNLNVATEDQLSLCVGREDAQWITKERQCRGNFVGWDDFNERAGSEKVAKRQEYVALKNTFVIPVNFNNATQKMMEQLNFHLSDDSVERLIGSAPCSSWVDLLKEFSLRDDTLSLLQQLFVLPAYDIHRYLLRPRSFKDIKTLRKSAFNKKERTDILKHRKHLDYFTGFEVDLDGETNYVVEHINEVQLGDLAWQQGPEELFGCIINRKTYKKKTFSLFNDKANLNLTTAEINESKKVLVEAWKKQFVSGYSGEVKPILQILEKNKDKDWVTRVHPMHWINIIKAMVGAFTEMLLIAFDCRIHDRFPRSCTKFSAEEMLVLTRQDCLTDERYADAALFIFLEKLYRMISPIAKEMKTPFPIFGCVNDVIFAALSPPSSTSARPSQRCRL